MRVAANKVAETATLLPTKTTNFSGWENEMVIGRNTVFTFSTELLSAQHIVNWGD